MTLLLMFCLNWRQLWVSFNCWWVKILAYNESQYALFVRVRRTNVIPWPKLNYKYQCWKLFIDEVRPNIIGVNPRTRVQSLIRFSHDCSLLILRLLSLEQQVSCMWNSSTNTRAMARVSQLFSCSVAQRCNQPFVSAASNCFQRLFVGFWSNTNVVFCTRPWRLMLETYCMPKQLAKEEWLGRARGPRRWRMMTLSLNRHSSSRFAMDSRAYATHFPHVFCLAFTYWCSVWFEMIAWSQVRDR